MDLPSSILIVPRDLNNVAQLPVVTQLDRSDFPEAPSWISKLLYPLQLFMTAVYTCLTRGLTYQDNMSSVIQRFSIVAGVLPENNTYSFQCSLGRQIVQLTAYCTNSDGSYTPVYPIVSWNFINSQVMINGIQGLTNTKKYEFIVVVS